MQHKLLHHRLNKKSQVAWKSNEMDQNPERNSTRGGLDREKVVNLLRRVQAVAHVDTNFTYNTDS